MCAKNVLSKSHRLFVVNEVVGCDVNVVVPDWHLEPLLKHHLDLDSEYDKARDRVKRESGLC